MKKKPVPIIDLFAGPGGLGEGFSQIGWRGGSPFFKIGLSVEKDPVARRTLKLRSFLRQFAYHEIPSEYFEFLRQERDPEELYSLEAYMAQADAAEREALEDTLRNDEQFHRELDQKIQGALDGRRDWVLIGGPPCQAYSVAGRVRNKGISGYDPLTDERYFLYKEYCRIIAVHQPAVFVMENVKGILSAKVDGDHVFDRILDALRTPPGGLGLNYRIFSLVKEPGDFDEPVYDKKDYVIESEKFGIPQARHRVILLGVRDDICETGARPAVLTKQDPVNVDQVIAIPRLRSGISKVKHDKHDWRKAVKSFPVDELSLEIKELAGNRVLSVIKRSLENISLPHADGGSDFVPRQPAAIEDDRLLKWYQDLRIGGVYNHSARAHMISDLHRYLYVSCFAQVKRRSPRMEEIPELLKPAHKNRDSGHFKVRFRVQTPQGPGHTVTSHISKDGHDNIHPDPTQCRSFTVREAARLQTFPDNYFFCGNRTEQYIQVGNAVPPLLANQIAIVVKNLLKEAFGDIG